MMLKNLGLATLLVATPAIAGEVTGTGESTPVRSGAANSVCAYSGLNDDGAGPSQLVQSYGMLVAAFGQGSAMSPGIACRGN